MATGFGQLPNNAPPVAAGPDLRRAEARLAPAAALARPRRSRELLRFLAPSCGPEGPEGP